MSYHRVLLALIIGWLMAVIAPITHANNALPDLGSSARINVTPQTEEILRLSFLQSIHLYTNLNTDPELNDYINDIGQRLLRHTRTQRHFQFFLINDENINAFAGPGGIIGVNTGLLIAAKTEDEIAAVLAHEIEHVEQEHLSRMFEQQQKGLLPTMAGILGAILVGSQNPQAGLAIMTGSIAHQLENQLSFSREHEWEADRLGIELLANAGYNPDAMADFFETLTDRYRTSNKGSELLQSHPVTEKRISDSRSKARQITRRTTKHASIDLALAQARLEALSQRSSTQKDHDIYCYQQKVVAWIKQTSQPLCSIKQKHLWFEILSLQTSKDSVQQQTQNWKKLLQLYPQQLSIWQRYAEHLYDAGKYTDLISELLIKAKENPSKFDFWQLIARAYFAEKDESSSAWALSKGYGEIGMFKLSKVQLLRAQQTHTDSQNTQLHYLLEVQSNWLDNKEKQIKNLE